MYVAGRVYRCACPYQSSCEDLALLLEELDISRLVKLSTYLTAESICQVSVVGYLFRHTN